MSIQDDRRSESEGSATAPPTPAGREANPGARSAEGPSPDSGCGLEPSGIIADTLDVVYVLDWRDNFGNWATRSVFADKTRARDVRRTLESYPDQKGRYRVRRISLTW